MTTDASSHPRRRLTWSWPDFDRLARPTFAVGVLVSGLFLFHLTRGTSFWADDWTWITTRRGNTVDAFLAPYNGHLSLVAIAIYRTMFAVFGIGSYAPYRVSVIALSLLVAVLVYVYARARTGELIAALLGGSLLFLGPGWQDTLWSFQIPWLFVCAAGIVALMLLERRTTAADGAACALILLAIASTSLGVAFTIGIAVDLAFARRRWRDTWIVVIPVGLYAIWSLHYHPSQLDLSAIGSIPVNVAQAAALALSGLAGLSGVAPFNPAGTSLTYGWPLLALAAALVFWRARSVALSARAISLTATFVAFAASVSIVHGVLASVLSSRYVYVYCLLATLLIAELASGVRLSRLAQGSLCFLALAAVVSNIGSLRSFGAYFRQSGAVTNGALTAVELDRGSVSPPTRVQIALSSFVKLSARAYFDVERILGTPAYTVAQLRRGDATAQSAADGQQLTDGDVTLTSSAGRATTPSGSLPAVAASANGTVAPAGSCIRFTPAAALPPGSIASASLHLTPGAMTVTADATAASLSVRRFAPTFTPLGAVTARRSAIVRVRRDAAPDPWYLQVSGVSPVQVCTLTR